MIATYPALLTQEAWFILRFPYEASNEWEILHIPMKCHIALGLQYLHRPLIDVDLLMYKEWHITACGRMMAQPEGKRPHWIPRRRWKVDDDDDDDDEFSRNLLEMPGLYVAG